MNFQGKTLESITTEIAVYGCGGGGGGCGGGGETLKT